VSTLKNPTHHYTQPGFYDVMLTISKGIKSDTEIKYDYIEVYTPLAANFIADKTFALTGDSIQFTDLSPGSPQSWKWDFGNGQSSIIQNPHFAFNTPGIYSVELLVKANWRADSLTKFNYITIADPLIAGFEADKTLAFVGETIHFTDFTQGNPASWFWDFGNGLTSTQQNPECLYNSSGTYTVKLIVTNTWLADTLIIENFITIVEPLIADFIVSKTTAFTGDSIVFTDLTQGNPESWLWDFGNGATSTLQNPVYTFSAPGIYNIKLVVATSWLTDSLINENYITVLQPLTSNFKADTTFAWLGHTTQFTDLSAGSPTSWSWDFGDLALSQLQNPSHTYNREGTFNVTLSVANQYQNKTEVKLNYVTIREPLKAAFKADTTKVIVGQSIRFTNLSTGFPTSRIWDFGDFTVSPLLNPRHSYAKPGYYTVSLQVFENDSTDFEIKENYIWVRDTLVAGFYATPLTIYAGESVNFYDTSRGSPNKWRWYFGEGKTNNLQNPVYKYNYPGVYTVRLIVSNPFDTDTLIRQSYITVLSPPLLQVVTLPQGWSGISTYLLPLNPGLPYVFQTIGDKLVFAMNDAGIYWPSQNINTIGNWNPQDGLIIKMTNEAQIEIRGNLMPDDHVNLSAGWNILPVISTCSQSTTDVFSPLGDTLVIIKEIAGTNVFWPQPGINNLQYIDHGKAYYILVNSDVLINFSDCNQDAGFIKTSETNSFFNPWNDFQKTSSSHTIAIDKLAFIENVANDVLFENDDVIGVFNENGFCSGIVKIYGLSSQDILAKPLVITAFGNNDGKNAADGFSHAEKMVFRLFKARIGDFYELSTSFENEFPNDDLFEINGLSGIGYFKIEKLIQEETDIQIFPSQEERIFRIEIKDIAGIVNLEILTAKGNPVENLNLDTTKINFLDMKNYETGIYLLRFSNNEFQTTKKLVLH
jgi:PKD repeat protein